MWEKGADDEVFSHQASQKLLPNVFCFCFFIVCVVVVENAQHKAPFDVVFIVFLCL